MVWCDGVLSLVGRYVWKEVEKEAWFFYAWTDHLHSKIVSVVLLLLLIVSAVPKAEVSVLECVPVCTLVNI